MNFLVFVLSYCLPACTSSTLDAKEQQDAINEVQILAALDSPFVVRYYDSFIDANALNIVMELCANGDVNALLKAWASALLSIDATFHSAFPSMSQKQHGKLMTENQVWFFFIQMACGLFRTCTSLIPAPSLLTRTTLGWRCPDIHSKNILHRDIKSMCASA